MIILVAIAAAGIADIVGPPVVVAILTTDRGDQIVVAEIIRQVTEGIEMNLRTVTRDGDTSHHLLTTGDIHQMTGNRCRLTNPAGFFLVTTARKTTLTSNALI